MRLSIRLMLASFLLLPLLFQKTDAAHSRRRPTVVRPTSENRYDRSITTFSSDGRLLQVEYGMKASSRGNTIAAFDLDFGGINAVCVAVVTDDTTSEDDSSEDEGDTMESKGMMMELEFNKVHRIDSHALLITTGLSGDGRALANAVRLGCQRMRLSYGESPTIKEVADAVGGMQHELTRVGGARPFGVTATVVGVDPLPDDDDEEDGSESGEEGGASRAETVLGIPKLYQSEPGGLVERFDVCSAGREGDVVLKALLRLREKLLVMSRSENDVKGEDDASADESAEKSNSGKQVGRVNLLGEMVQGVTRAALLDDIDPVASRTAIPNKRRRRRADVWVVQGDGTRRGGARMRMARNVGLGELDVLKEIFSP